MKKLLLLSLSFFSCLSSFAAAPRMTANYYQENNRAESFNGKSVSLYICKANRLQSTIRGKKGYVCFSCLTCYKDKIGGSTTIYVPESRASGFEKTYGDIKNTATIKGSSSNFFPSKSVKVKLCYEENKIYYMVE